MTTVHRDERRGHFVLDLAPHGQIEREVIGADLGSTLHLTMRGAHLTPTEARMLAETLVWWAGRKHVDDNDTERLVEINDLFHLMEDAS